MKRKVLMFATILLVMTCMSSCVSDDDFVQEGTLRVTFTAFEVDEQTSVTVEVMDFADNPGNAHPVMELNSMGRKPIEARLNVGNYLVRTMYGLKTDLRGVQIRKDETTEIKF